MNATELARRITPCYIGLLSRRRRRCYRALCSSFSSAPSLANMVNAPENVVPAFPPFEYANLLDKPIFGDFRDALAVDGFVVIPEAVQREKALQYRDRAFDWLESFNLGFDRKDESTWVNEVRPFTSHRPRARASCGSNSIADFASSSPTETARAHEGVA